MQNGMTCISAKHLIQMVWSWKVQCIIWGQKNVLLPVIIVAPENTAGYNVLLDTMQSTHEKYIPDFWTLIHANQNTDTAELKGKTRRKTAERWKKIQPTERGSLPIANFNLRQSKTRGKLEITVSFRSENFKKWNIEGIGNWKLEIEWNANSRKFKCSRVYI